VLDLGPNTLDEALTAAQRYESNQKVLNKGSTRVLSSTSGEEEGASSASYSAFHTRFGPQQGDQEPPPWAKELFQQQVEKHSSGETGIKRGEMWQSDPSNVAV